MSRFMIVTDGTCTLPSSFYAQHDVAVLPLHVNFGTDGYTDGVDLTRERFYELLATRPEIPRTSQPSLGECRELYERVMGDGTRDVLVVTLDASRSGTYAVAQAAAQTMPGNVVVVDSRTVSGGLGFIVSACARARRNGRSFEETVALAQRLAGKPQIIVYMDTIKYAKESGRISVARALAAQLLGIKPILKFAGGEPEMIDRVRTRSKGLARLRELTVAAVGEGTRAHMCVLHTNSRRDAEELGEWVQRTFHCVEFFVEEAGPTLAAHVGPGIVAAGFLKEDAA